MNEGVIEASYLWTMDEFLAASEANQGQSRQWIVRYGVRFLVVTFAFTGGLLLVYGDRTAWPVAIGLLLLSVFLLYAFSASNRRRVLRRAFRRAGVMAEPDQKVTFIADERAIRLVSAGTDLSWVWELVPKVVETRAGFLVIHAARARWLPFHAFRDEADRERFASLAERRAVKYVGLPR